MGNYIVKEVGALYDLLTTTALDVTPVAANVLTNIHGRDLFIETALDDLDKGDSTAVDSIVNLAMENLDRATWTDTDCAVAEVAYACVFLKGDFVSMLDLGGKVWERLETDEETKENPYHYSLLRLLNKAQWQVTRGVMSYDTLREIFARSTRAAREDTQRLISMSS